MWIRSELKNQAKGFLRQNYWKAFLVVLITMILAGNLSNVGKQSGNNTLDFNHQFNLNEMDNISQNFQTPSSAFEFTNKAIFTPLAILGIGGAIVTSIFAALVLISLGFVAQVGQSRFFLDGFEGDVEINKLFSGFNSKEYIPIVKAQGLAYISIILWTFLLIVPGIIKAYQYRFVPYLLAEDASLQPREALERSKAMTMGHKGNIFILDFSFILWHLLSIFTFGLSSFFVAPYVEATNAKLYKVLSSNNYTDSMY